MKSIVVCFLSVFICGMSLFGQINTGTDGILTNDNSNFISVNEVMMWLSNNGMGSHDPRTDASGFYWPGGEECNTLCNFCRRIGLGWNSQWTS